MSKLLLTLVLGVLSFSAMGKASSLISTSQPAPTQDSIFKQVFHVAEGEYDLYIISTCITGIGEVSMGHFTLGGYGKTIAMLEQEFVFTKNGRTLKQCLSPVRRIQATTLSGHTYSFLEVPINGVRIISTNDGTYYEFLNVKLEEMAPDIKLVYNIKGDLIIYTYQADYRVVEIDGLLELTPDYDFELNKDSYKDYDKLIHSAIKWGAYFNDAVFPIYDEADKK